MSGATLIGLDHRSELKGNCLVEEIASSTKQVEGLCKSDPPNTRKSLVNNVALACLNRMYIVL